MLLLPERQISEAWEPSEKQCFFCKSSSTGQKSTFTVFVFKASLIISLHCPSPRGHTSGVYRSVRMNASNLSSEFKAPSHVFPFIYTRASKRTGYDDNVLKTCLTNFPQHQVGDAIPTSRNGKQCCASNAANKHSFRHYVSTQQHTIT